MNTRFNTLDKLFSRKELHQAEREKFEETAGVHYGLVFGIGLVLVGWGWDAYELWRASNEFFWLKLLLIALVIIPLTALAGTIAGHIHRSNLRKMIVWVLIGSVLGPISLLMSTEGLSTVIALFDATIRGVTLYPFSAGLQERVVLTAVFGAVIGVLATAMQKLTTAWAWDNSSNDNRFTFASWTLLWACAPLAIALGALYDGSLNSQMRAPVQLSHRLIELMLTTPPDADIRAMNTFTMLDYVNTSKWQKDFTTHYVQRIADLDPRTLTSAFVDVEFDNGFIWRCQSVRNGDNWKDCLDLSPQYRDWMQQFLRTGIVQCGECLVTIPPPTQIWYAQNASHLGTPQQISIAHHAGGVILVTATLANTQVDCRIVGASPAVIHDCAIR